MKTRALILVVPFSVVAGSAFGQGLLNGGIQDVTPYVGVNAGLLRYNEGGLNTLNPSVFFARLGIPISSYVAIEGRLGTGISSDQTNGYSVSVGAFGGGYVKGSVAIAPTFALYGVVGIVADTLHRNYGDGDTTDTGFSFGIGGDVTLSRGWLINFEWTRLPNGSEGGFSYDSNLFTAGASFHF